MRRIILGIAALLAIAVLVPVGSGIDVAEAAKKYKWNSCKGQTLAGKAVTWKCKLDEKCCFEALSGAGNCAPKSGICL